MLKLRNITKDYSCGDTTVAALRGITLDFRKNEFVSILGQSGCGKTTLLNIIGGLDQYTRGDLIINGKSTKDFKDADWDAYRNHKIGFVFQSYNLIPHQTVLANVELALTLSGVSREERRRRAIEALESVGLGDQLNKKPSQMSGGQMQRVAIARALVNDPDILLADEPTGALDSETSVQVMEILKKISATKLIIMVTHNPEIAEKYSTRIIRLLDGKVISDSEPYESEEIKVLFKKTKRDRTKSMSFITALSLSLNNLMTKKGRTFLTSFAGSIGIIGIALILSISNGITLYINSVEENTLSSYPIMIEAQTVDMTSMMENFIGQKASEGAHELDKVYSSDIMGDMLSAMLSEVTDNDLKAFKEFLDDETNGFSELTSDIKYGYSTPLNVYTLADFGDGEKLVQVEPSTVFEAAGMSQMTEMAEMANAMGGSMGGSMMGGIKVWDELIDNDELLASQYDIIAGRMPAEWNEIVIIVDKNNEIPDLALFSLGLKDQSKLDGMMGDIMMGEFHQDEATSYTYDEILSLEYYLLPNSAMYKRDGNTWVDHSDDEAYLKTLFNDENKIKIVGILRPSEDATATSISGNVGYLPSLMIHLIEENNASEIVKDQLENKEIDVFTGIGFKTNDEENKPMTMAHVEAYIASLPPEEAAGISATISQMKASGMPDEKIVEMFKEALEAQSTDATYDGNLTILGVSSLDEPSSIMIYPKDFDSKEIISDKISAYNAEKDEAEQLNYTDYIGIMLSSVTTIINAISYVLIAFVAISLVVSSIMIGIITYISVLERTKEIGILRAVGASKRDVSRVFNAETLIVGFAAGLLGIGVTLLLSIPINIIIEYYTDIANVATLPFVGAVALILISMVLTYLAGLIPARVAAKKDPVIALRSE